VLANELAELFGGVENLRGVGGHAAPLVETVQNA
jgi:hypothetical protein